jgi:hypothetical protein
MCVERLGVLLVSVGGDYLFYSAENMSKVSSHRVVSFIPSKFVGTVVCMLCMLGYMLAVASFIYAQEVVEGSATSTPTIVDSVPTPTTTSSSTSTTTESSPSEVSEVVAPIRIVAHKIVCTNETDLPNWGLGGPDITPTTASEWVSAHSSCSLAPEWEFQWSIAHSPAESTFVGRRGLPWKLFPNSTNAIGATSVEIDQSQLFGGMGVWVREVQKKGYLPFTFDEVIGVPNNDNNVSAELYCNTDINNYDNLDLVENVVSGGTYHCIAWNVALKDVTTPATVTAHKILCTNEADLPNWGLGGPDITANTAADWVAGHTSCSLVADWEFQWSPVHSPVPGDFVGRRGAPWKLFPNPTDASGKTTLSVTLNDLFGNNNLWVREVQKVNHIPFTFDEVTGVPTNANATTAEMYCAGDVNNYDNFDNVPNMVPGGTYHCVAWNVATTTSSSNGGGGGGNGTTTPDGNGTSTATTTTRIGGNVWNDINVNDLNDDNAPLAGITIRATSGSTTLVTVTNALGQYSFDLPPGTWTIAEDVPSGFNLTFPDLGTHTVMTPATTTSAYDFGNVGTSTSNGGGEGGSGGDGGGGGNGIRISLSDGDNNDSDTDQPQGEVRGDSDTNTGSSSSGEVRGAIAPSGAPNAGFGGADLPPHFTWMILLSSILTLGGVLISIRRLS